MEFRKLILLIPIAFAAFLTVLCLPSLAYALTWTPVNTDGFGDAGNTVAEAMAVYNGKLYVAADNSSTGTEVWEYNGSDWTQVNTDGFGNSEVWGIFSLAVHDGKLYAGTSDVEDTTGGEVWEYDGATWTKVGVDGFGTGTTIERVYALASFNGALYAGANNTGSVWRYDGGTDWTQVNTDGFGDGNNLDVNNLVVFNSKLYAGTTNVATGAEVWEYNGSDWTQVNTDGFGDGNNTIVQSLGVFGSKLYAGTFNATTGTEVWEYDGSAWTQANEDGFGDASKIRTFALQGTADSLYAGVYNFGIGAEVWEYDGSAWTQANEDGFGDANNDSVYSFAVFSGKIYAGTSNGTTGTEVWAATLPAPPPPPADTTPPSKPVLSKLGALTFNSAFKNWYLTGTRPKFSGIGEAGSTVFITIASDPITGSAAVGSDGKWSYTPSRDIPVGEHTVTIYSEDASGNRSSSLSFNLTVDPTGAIFPLSIWNLIFGTPVEAVEDEDTAPPVEEEEEEEETPDQEPGTEAPEEPKPAERKGLSTPWILGLGTAALLALIAFFARRR